FASLISLTFFACKKEDLTVKSNEFIIVTSFYPIYILAKNVAYNINDVKVVSMTSSDTGCLHDYSVTTEDMKNLEKADIFLTNGAGMETFIDKVTERYPNLKTVELSKGIRLIDDGDDKNPHVWMSVDNAITMVKNCVEALCMADIKNCDIYKKNGNSYIKELSNLKINMDERLKKFRGEKIITFHEAFSYFAEDYDLTIAAVVEHNPGIGPSAKDLADLIDTVRRLKIKYLFTEPQYSSSSADIIAKETGVKVFILDPIVTGADDKDTYIKAMEKNCFVLIGAFSGK
ncbi:MAG: metal ABC transporter substrate-binding protein, partial [Leptospirales bacterium]|nr:metal ABC transporter substrate-binding protein [Leptospirales bacterium]